MDVQCLNSETIKCMACVAASMDDSIVACCCAHGWNYRCVLIRAWMRITKFRGTGRMSSEIWGSLQMFHNFMSCLHLEYFSVELLCDVSGNANRNALITAFRHLNFYHAMINHIHISLEIKNLSRHARATKTRRISLHSLVSILYAKKYIYVKKI